LRRRQSQGIIDFFSFAERTARAAYADKPEDKRVELRREALIDVITLNVRPEVMAMCKSCPRDDMYTHLMEIASNEAKFPKVQQRRTQDKVCARCNNNNHSTMQCSLYFGKIPSQSCFKCHQGKHFSNFCMNNK
jgi:hypothetical protein